MAVDRGGLRYTIEVADKFSTATAAFRKEILASKAEFASFATQTRDLSRAQNALSASQQSVARSQRVVNTETRRLNRALLGGLSVSQESVTATDAQIQALRLQQVSIEKTRLSLNRLIATQKRRISTSVASAKALEGVNDAQARAALSQQRALPTLQSMTKAQAQYANSTDQLGRALPTTRKRLDSFEKTGKKTTGTFQTLLFTFRRLVGVFAAFAVARAVVGVFRSLVFEGVKFNAQLEQAELGIAAVIAATGTVRNAVGGATDAAEGFALAQAEARRQVNLLRKDALATNATFEQLLDTFQTAIGPGLAAGLDVDEIRKLSVRISQAATAIGLPQNQLAEEIRSILAGTIQLRTTRLAAVLGITNQDIRNARELGTLATFLQDRFAAFGRAGDESLNNLNVLLVNTSDGLRQVLAAGSEDLSGEALGTLRDLFGVLNDLDDNDRSIGLRPDAIELAATFTAGLREALVVVRQLVENLSFADLLPIAQTFSDVVTVIARVVGTIVEVLVEGVSDALVIVNSISSFFGAIIGFFGILNGQNSVFRSILTTALRIVVAFTSLRLIGIGLVATFGSLLKFAIAPLLTATIKLVELFAALPSILLRIKSVLLVLAKSPVLIAFTLIAAAVVFILERTGVLQKVFSVFSNDIESAEVGASRLSERFKELQGQIAGSSTQAEAFEKTIERIEEKLLKAQQQASFDLANVGVVGAARSERKALADAENLILKETEELVNKITTGQQTLLGIQRQRQISEDDLLQQSAEEIRLISSGVEAGTRQLEVRSRRVELDREISSLQLELQSQEERGDSQAAAASKQRLSDLGEERNATTAALLGALFLSDEVGKEISAIGETPQKSAEGIFQAISERLEAQGQETQQIKEINTLQEQRIEIEKLIRDAALERIASISVNETAELNKQNDVLSLQVENARRLAAARAGSVFGTETAEARIAAARNELDIEQQKLEILKQQQTLQLNAVFATLEQVKGTDAEGAALGNVNALILQQQTQRELLGLSIDDSNRKLELQKAIAESPIELGIDAAFEQFTEKSLNTFQSTFNILTTSLNSFASLISTSIVDAFDPTKKVDLKERFARFLQGIAQLVIQELVKIAITKAILNSGFGAGLAKGGPVTAGMGSPSLAHFSRGAQGYNAGGGVAGGGFTPPAGVSRKDTVPAWLQPKEYVQPVSSVRMYGDDFMHAVKNRLFPKETIRALMTGVSMTNARRRTASGMGFQTGGSIPKAAATASFTPTASGGGGGQAVVAPTARSVERLERGGKSAKLRFFGSNRAEISSALDRGTPNP